MDFNATFFISAISFIVFTFLMNLILYKPLENIVKERENLINGNYDEANKAKEKTQTLLEFVADKLAQARSEARSVIIAKKQEATLKATKLISDAKEESANFVTEKKAELQNEVQIIEENTDIVATAQLISDKLLRENIPIGGN